MQHERARDGAPWREWSRFTSPDAYEVSCRVRVGEVTRPDSVPDLAGRGRLRGFTPRSARIGHPGNGSPASAMRCSGCPGVVAELGVRLGGFSEGEKRTRSYLTRRSDVTSGSRSWGKTLRSVTEFTPSGEHLSLDRSRPTRHWGDSQKPHKYLLPLVQLDTLRKARNRPSAFDRRGTGW